MGKRLLLRLLTLSLLAVVLTPVFAFSAVGSAHATTTLDQYRAWIAQAKTMYPYPQSTDKMYRVMMCESSGNPYAKSPGAHYLGLFQYAPSTWAGRWNPYRANSLYDARSQIFATAKAWSIGMQGQWSCYYITAGR